MIVLLVFDCRQQGLSPSFLVMRDLYSRFAVHFFAFPIQLLFYQHGNIPSANAAIFRFSDASTGATSERSVCHFILLNHILVNVRRGVGHNARKNMYLFFYLLMGGLVLSLMMLFLIFL